MLTVLADMPFSRRQRFHHIVDSESNIKASFQTMTAVFDWLVANDELKIVLKTEEALYKLDISIWQ